MHSKSDVWALGEVYESYVGRWSRAVAAKFLTWLAVPPRRSWLDVGCGTGALSQAILDRCDPAAVSGIDSSDGFLTLARRQIQDARATFELADARSLPFADGTFDAIVSALALNFLPDRPGALTEMRRTARPGGVVAAYVWDYAGGMQMMRFFWNAASAVDPAARELDEARRFPLCQPDPLRELFEGSGLGSVEVAGLEVPTAFRDFDDLWTPFLGGQGPAPTYLVSLDPDRQDAIRRRMQDSVPVNPDGNIQLSAKAWAVRGTA
jgi:SAM-dependent methyltransferase